jgi:hypothetical protein
MIGPEKQVESAMHFFRALRVYPNPVELLMSKFSLLYLISFLHINPWFHMISFVQRFRPEPLLSPP